MRLRLASSSVVCFPLYVVSAYRRTSHGPAKAGHYVQETDLVAQRKSDAGDDGARQAGITKGGLVHRVTDIVGAKEHGQ